MSLFIECRAFCSARKKKKNSSLSVKSVVDHILPRPKKSTHEMSAAVDSFGNYVTVVTRSCFSLSLVECVLAQPNLLTVSKKEEYNMMANLYIRQAYSLFPIAHDNALRS